MKILVTGMAVGLGLLASNAFAARSVLMECITDHYAIYVWSDGASIDVAYGDSGAAMYSIVRKADVVADGTHRSSAFEVRPLHPGDAATSDGFTGTLDLRADNRTSQKILWVGANGGVVRSVECTGGSVSF